VTDKLPVKLEGITQPFQGNGRTFGYPTANIAAETALTDGVYFGFADLADYKHRPALIFVGIPVTVGDTERRVEAHLLDIADVDYYGQPLQLQVEYFHRANQKLDGIDALLAIMKQDEAAARHWFAVKENLHS